MENENLNEGLEQVGKLIVNKLKVLAEEDKFVANGDLIRSFRYETTANNLAIFSAKYARALSDGISKKNPNHNEVSEKFKNNIKQWAKAKGITPRDKKGRFVKIKDYTFNSMYIAIAKSIRKRGISKRFEYQGSGFFQTMEDQLKEQIRTILSESYKKDLKLQIKRDGINTN